MNKQQREAVKARLAEIERRNGGRLTPSDVVSDAKDQASPLHGCFEWDLSKAAEKHWIEQARALITSVHVVYRTETTNIRAVYYVRDPSADGDQQGYVSVERLRTESDMARDALIAEFGRVADMLRRARDLADILNSRSEVESLLQNVVGLRNRWSESSEIRQ